MSGVTVSLAQYRHESTSADIIACQPKTFPAEPDRKERRGEIKVGSGVQGIPRFHRWFHELASEYTPMHLRVSHEDML